MVADSATGIFLHLELQRGKKEMKKPELLEFANQFGGTVACSKQSAKETVQNNNNDNDIKNLWMGDSWFGSVKTAVQVAEYGNFIGIVKTAHSFYPKQWLEEKMKGWPGGSHLVLEGTKDNIPLIAIGYKYNKKKVICFIATKGSGHTEPGQPYEATWKDENGGNMVRYVNQPQLVALYFGASNIIDKGNQSRQSDLRLEKHWVTNDGFF